MVEGIEEDLPDAVSAGREAGIHSRKDAVVGLREKALEMRGAFGPLVRAVQIVDGLPIEGGIVGQADIVEVADEETAVDGDQRAENTAENALLGGLPKLGLVSNGIAGEEEFLDGASDVRAVGFGCIVKERDESGDRIGVVEFVFDDPTNDEGMLGDGKRAVAVETRFAGEGDGDVLDVYLFGTGIEGIEEDVGLGFDIGTAGILRHGEPREIRNEKLEMRKATKVAMCAKGGLGIGCHQS